MNTVRNGYIEHWFYRCVVASHSLNHIHILNPLYSFNRLNHRHAGASALHLQHALSSPCRASGGLCIPRRLVPAQWYCPLLTQASYQSRVVLDWCKYLVGVDVWVDGGGNQEPPSNLGFEVGSFCYTWFVIQSFTFFPSALARA